MCPFTMEGPGPEEKKAEQCSMPWYHRWWIPPPMGDKMVRVSVPSGRIYFWFCASSLVLRRADSANEMHWASITMHYTASLPSMRAESDGKVKWDSKRKEYKRPCPEKVCNYGVKCIVCASAIPMARTRTMPFTHTNWCIYIVA